MTQEALKLALKHGSFPQGSGVIHVLKKALAQTEHDYERGFIDGMQKQMQSSVDKAVNRMAQEKALQALHSENERLGLYKDAYAQLEQEPVAWMYQEYRDDDQFGWRDEIQFVQPPNDPNYFRNIVPVYTTPKEKNSA
jgi:hypothetical protein